MGEGDQHTMEGRAAKDKVRHLCLCRQKCVMGHRVKASKRRKVTGNGSDKIVWYHRSLSQAD